jgi:acyl carrier protein
MDRREIVEKTCDVLRDFFGDAAGDVTEETNSESVEDWDSVSHIQVIFEIEEVFGVQFDADDIPQLVSVGAIADEVEALLERDEG